MKSDDQVHFKAAFENMFNAFAHCQAIYDDAGNCVDFVYLMVNPAFERHTGLVDVIGKHMTELIPGVLSDNPEVLKIYERVSKGGHPESVEGYTQTMGIWFNLLVFSLEPGTFSAIFENVSGHRELSEKLQQSNEDLLEAYDDTLMCLVRALQFRDAETDHHSERVTATTIAFARYVGIEEKYMADIRRGALLHDIGKLFTPDAILRKPGRLTYAETLEMQKHPQQAYDLLFPVKFLQGCVIDIPHCHHERWDGSGYPNGLKDKNIPFCARLFAVVDVFDAMTSERVYRKQALSKGFTLAYIELQSGILFDPTIVTAFMKFIEL